MTWLNALLAFSLAMIIFCTMASAVQEALQHLLHSRERWLRGMITKFIEDTISKDLPNLGAAPEDMAKKLLENRAVDGKSKHRPLDWIAPRELFLRLAEGDVGKELRTMAGASAGAYFTKWSEAFERMQGDASALFATRARSISVVIALGLAIALNVDAVRLFNAFLTDDQLTARILEHGDAITQRFAEQQNATAAAGAVTAGSAAEQAFDATLDKLRTDIDASTAIGLPFGSHFFPYCADPSTDPLCAATTMTTLTYLRWAASVLLAGVLIGLGGPFWFNAFTSLSAMVQSIRPSSSTTPDKAQGAATEAAATSNPTEIVAAAVAHMHNGAPPVQRL